MDVPGVAKETDLATKDPATTCGVFFFLCNPKGRSLKIVEITLLGRIWIRNIMEITKNANGEKNLSLTKSEYAELSKRYKFIRNAQIIKTADAEFVSNVVTATNKFFDAACDDYVDVLVKTAQITMRNKTRTMPTIHEPTKNPKADSGVNGKEIGYSAQAHAAEELYHSVATLSQRLTVSLDPATAEKAYNDVKSKLQAIATDFNAKLRDRKRMLDKAAEDLLKTMPPFEDKKRLKMWVSIVLKQIKSKVYELMGQSTVNEQKNTLMQGKKDGKNTGWFNGLKQNLKERIMPKKKPAPDKSAPKAPTKPTRTQPSFKTEDARLQVAKSQIAIKTAQSDDKLPAFMDQVDQLYRSMFNMPGGMPNTIKEMLAGGIRSGLKNTQTGSPINGTEPATDPNNVFDGDTDQDMADTDLTDEVSPVDALHTPDYGTQDSDTGDTGTLPLEEEPMSGANNDRLNQQMIDPTTDFDDENTPTSLRSKPIGEGNGELATRTPDDVDNGFAPTNEDKYDFVEDDIHNPDWKKKYESAHGREVPSFASKNLDDSVNVYRHGTKFANGIDFKQLKAQMNDFGTQHQIEETPEGQRAENIEDVRNNPAGPVQVGDAVEILKGKFTGQSAQVATVKPDGTIHAVVNNQKYSFRPESYRPKLPR